LPQAHRIALVLIPITIIALTVVQRFDAMLVSFHQPGEIAAGVPAVTGLFLTPASRSTSLLDAVRSWAFYAQTQPRSNGSDRADARWFVQGYVGFDSLLLVPVYALLAAFSIAWSRQMLEQQWITISRTADIHAPARAGPPPDETCDTTRECLPGPPGRLDTWTAATGHRSRWIRALDSLLIRDLPALWRSQGDQTTVQRFANWNKTALVAVAIAISADWVENVLTILVVRLAWPAAPLTDAAIHLTCGGASWPESLPCNLAVMTVLTVCTGIKTFCLLIVAYHLVAVGFLWLRHAGRDDTTWWYAMSAWHTVSALRLPLVVVVAFGLTLFSNDQLPDIVRRWVREPGVGLVGVLLTFVLALSLACISRWLLTPRREDREPPEPWRPAAAIGIGYAALWLVFAAVARGSDWWFAWSVGLGLLYLLVLPRVYALPRRGAFAAIVAGGLLLVGFSLYAQSLKPAAPLIVAAGVWLLGTSFREWPASPWRSQRQGDPEPIDGGRHGLPWLIAAAILMLLTVSTVSTGMDVLLFELWLAPHITLLEQFEQVWSWLLMYGFVGLAGAVVVTWLGARRFLRPPAPLAGSRLRMALRFLTLGVAGWTAVAGLLAMDADRVHLVTPWLGGIGVLSLMLVLLSFTGAGLIMVTDHGVHPVPPLFRALSLRRLPVMSLLGIWFLLAALLPPEEGTHDVRLVAATGSEWVPPVARRANLALDPHVRTGEKLADAFDQWRYDHCLLPYMAPPAPPTQRRAVPLILVASAGGGIRSAAWTTYVLDRTFSYGKDASSGACAPPADGSSTESPAPRDSSWIFAGSGISGGSVGLSIFAARQGTYDARGLTASDFGVPAPDPETAPGRAAGSERVRGWVRDQIGRDAVAAPLGWLLLVEAPWSLFRFPLDRDRAAILEETWDRSWWPPMPDESGNEGSRPPYFFELRQRAPTLPLLILNGASVESGCRFNTSVLAASGRKRNEPSQRCLAPRDLHAAPGSLFGTDGDLVQFMCANKDLRLSTAALLSARFPVISPSGRLTQVQDCAAEPEQQGVGTRTYLVDGGYHEGSAAATVLELWNALAPLVDEHNSDAAAPAFIIPFLMQIDNGYGEPAAPGTVPSYPQILVPLVTVTGSFSAGSERARQAAQIAFQHEYKINSLAQCYNGERYAHFALRAHPGPSAPLGWTLSDVAFDDLVDQFLSEDAGQKPYRLVQQWLSIPVGVWAETCPKTSLAPLTQPSPTPATTP
jgi:hypothetical protein